MELYLIRHTAPKIDKGICYGQTDLDVAASFEAEVAAMLPHLPASVEVVYASPLRRCALLAQTLFPSHPIIYDERLKEMHFGDWEGKLWNEIDAVVLQQWMDAFVHEQVPGGESFQTLHARVCNWLEELPQYNSVAVVAHSGVIRSLLSHFENRDLSEAFSSYSVNYGAVVRLHIEDSLQSYHFLHNPSAENPRPKES